MKLLSLLAFPRLGDLSQERQQRAARRRQCLGRLRHLHFLRSLPPSPPRLLWAHEAAAFLGRMQLLFWVLLWVHIRVHVRVHVRVLLAQLEPRPLLQEALLTFHDA